MALSNADEQKVVRLGQLEKFKLLGGVGNSVMVNASSTQVTVVLTANRHYSFGEVTSLTVTLGSPVTTGTGNVTHYPTEYNFEFDSGSTATTLSLPAGIVWQNEPSSPETNKHYEISIKYSPATGSYYGLWAEWDLPTE